MAAPRQHDLEASLAARATHLHPTHPGHPIQAAHPLQTLSATSASAARPLSPAPGARPLSSASGARPPSPATRPFSPASASTSPEDAAAVQRDLLELAESMVASHQTYFKRFERLYIYNILQYQYELLRLDAELSDDAAMKGDPGERVQKTKELRALLSEYNAAIQDAQSVLTMRTVPSEYSRTILRAQASEFPDAPTPLTTFTTHRERLLALDVGLSTGLLDIMSSTSAFLGDKPYIHDKGAQKHRTVRWWNKVVKHSWDAMIRTGWFGRFVFGVVGGAFLVVPMVLMLFVPGRAAQLWTVSLSIVVFVMMMAVVTRGSMQDIFGATAAYAAVLVVFVGVQS